MHHDISPRDIKSKQFTPNARVALEKGKCFDDPKFVLVLGFKQAQQAYIIPVLESHLTMRSKNISSEPVWRHYGWLITVACTICVAVALGFGRFALGMLLPAMGASLQLDYAEMGFVSTFNFVGYTIGVIAAPLLVPLIGERWTIAGGLIIVALSLLAVGQAAGFISLLVIYSLTGVAGGCANVTALGLVSHWFTRKLRGMAAGFQVSGSSFAIIFVGLTLPSINVAVGPDGWRVGWMLLGSLSILGALFAGVVLRNRPAALGLKPAGTNNDIPSTNKVRGHPGAQTVTHLGIIYFFFGMTYSVYLTFMVTSLVRERGLSEIEAGHFWTILGLMTLISGPVFGFLSDKLGRKNALAIAFSVYGTAYALAAIGSGVLSQWASVSIFGLAGWSIPAILGAAVGDYSGPRNAVKVLGTITVAFSIGQVTGPALGGLLAEATGSFVPGYWAIAAASAIAILISLALPPPKLTNVD